jgi:hypothetical protein
LMYNRPLNSSAITHPFGTREQVSIITLLNSNSPTVTANRTTLVHRCPVTSRTTHSWLHQLLRAYHTCFNGAGTAAAIANKHISVVTRLCSNATAITANSSADRCRVHINALVPDFDGAL